MKGAPSTGARTRARELLLQALYQKQIAGHDRRELLSQFKEQVAYQRVDQAFFEELLRAICDTQETLEETIGGLIDRPLEQLDPVELGILLIGVYELQSRIDRTIGAALGAAVALGRP